MADLSEKEKFILLIKNYSKQSVEFGKDLAYLCFRNHGKKEDFLNDLFSHEVLKIVVRQKRNNEERLLLYYIYSRRKGRAYVLRFYPEKIRVITIYPLGNKTLKKYHKRKFKNNKGV